jgi:hypothetical protein
MPPQPAGHRPESARLIGLAIVRAIIAISPIVTNIALVVSQLSAIFLHIFVDCFSTLLVTAPQIPALRLLVVMKAFAFILNRSLVLSDIPLRVALS